MVEAVKQNFPQREIADASYELQGEIDARRPRRRRRQPLHRGRRRRHADPARSTRRWSASRSTASRPSAAARDGAAVEARARRAPARPRPRDDANLMPPLLDAARAHATEGEIVDALQEVFGAYTETPSSESRPDRPEEIVP